MRKCKFINLCFRICVPLSYDLFSFDLELKYRIISLAFMESSLSHSQIIYILWINTLQHLTCKLKAVLMELLQNTTRNNTDR